MKYILLLFLPLFSYLPTTAQTLYWQQQTNYSIDVALNDKDNSLQAFETIQYTNHSPDTLQYIWFHLWPNAYKNDRTAYSEQTVRNGYTDFYFSKEDMRGYINQLDFKVDGINAVTEPDSNNIDIVKLLLPLALEPGKVISITTPFHVKLPYNFSRGGHVGETFQITQWYPKPAVYDSKGWHPIPYLDQGEFYSEFGNFSVNITVPENYIVAASGILSDKEELGKLQQLGKQKLTAQKNYKLFQNLLADVKKGEHPLYESLMPASSAKTNTLHYTLNNAHDFAWFASKLFLVQYDSLYLNSKTIDAFSFFHPWQIDNWKESIEFAKEGTRYYSNRVGEYPYPTVSVVAGSDVAGSDGMEYPTITLITSQQGGQSLDATIAHEIGHNWFYGILASNERDHAWMDEGINTYYQESYEKEKYKKSEDYFESKDNFISKKLPESFNETIITTLEKIHKDQRIDLPSIDYSEINYGMMVYEKTAWWMRNLEKELGHNQFDITMQQYFTNWKFRHPYPEDFKQSIGQISAKNMDSTFALLYNSGALKSESISKQIRLTGIFNLKETDKYHYVSVLPALGFNAYDKLMVGLLFHNYQLPVNRFNFLAAPVYATQTKKLGGTGRVSYSSFKKRYWLETSISTSSYSINDYTKDDGSKLSLNLMRIVPSVKFTLYNKDIRSRQKFIIHARSFIVQEEALEFETIDSINLITKKAVQKVINQLSFTAEDTRKLYPYSASLVIDQGKQFVRAGFTGKYFFNYADGKNGLQARFFAGKFFYTQSKNFLTQFATDPYQLNLSAPKGYEDYTYSNYFVGRNEFEGWQSQQIAERDGFFKVRTDLLGTKIGKSDDWLMAINFCGNIPDKINPLTVLPFKLPIKFFVDLGTYSAAWKDNNPTGSFLFDAGLQLSPLKGLINIYVPLLYSKVYSDYFKSTLGENRFLKTISFDINLQVFKLNNLIPEIPL